MSPIVEALLGGAVNAAAALLVAALGHDEAKEKLAERAAILTARTAADAMAAKKFGTPP